MQSVSIEDRRILMNFVTHCYFAMGLFYRRERNISLWHCMALVDRMKIPNIMWLNELDWTGRDRHHGV